MSVLFCDAAAGSVVLLIAPLKGQSRAVVKTLEKYGGYFSRLTDLARATFECDTLRCARAVVEALVAFKWPLLLIKDRCSLV